MSVNASVKKLFPESDMIQIPGKPYKMCRTQVTQAQWVAVMGRNPSEFRGNDLPVENVSWDECREFIKCLKVITSVKYRLPTEEEWVYACRAGSTGDWGKRANGEEGPLDVMGWYDENSDDETHPVAQKEPNAWGLYDMHGNVWEWTSTSSGLYRVYRGGCWLYYGSRATDRDRVSPSNRYSILGFRLACSSGLWE